MKKRMPSWSASGTWSGNGRLKRREPDDLSNSQRVSILVPPHVTLSLNPTVPFMLRNIWTAGLVLFALIMFSTFFIHKVWQVRFRRSSLGYDHGSR